MCIRDSHAQQRQPPEMAHMEDDFAHHEHRRQPHRVEHRLPRAAFDFVETLCQAEKLPAIYLTVNKKNFHAIEVYKYFGFHQTDAVVTDIGSGFVMNDYIMQLKIEE